MVGAEDILGSWTFNSGATTAQRLQSSGSPSGVTVSSLSINPSVADFGLGTVPSGNDDGMGFGGNQGEQTLFWHRANFFNPNTPSTTWGIPGVTTGIDTTVANAPMSFTVTASATHSVTVESITIDANSTTNSIVYVQEAGQAAGTGVAGVDITVPLNEPVSIAAGASKTFTINWNSGALDSKLIITQIDVNGVPGSIWSNGQGNGLWDFTSTNWISPDDRFSNGDAIAFDDTAPGAVTISGANVAPSTVLFRDAYTIDSAAAETLSAHITVADSAAVAINSVISGASAITNSGTLTLNGTNTFTGGVVVESNATLVAGNDRALGSTTQATALTVEPGGTLSIGFNISLSSYGVGSIKVGGTIQKTTGGNFNVFNGPLDFIGDATIFNTARLDFDGQLSNNTGSRVTLTKIGGQRLFINNTIVGDGFDWDIKQGQITLEGIRDSSLNSSFTVNAGTILQVRTEGSNTVVGDLVLNGGTMEVSGQANTWTFSGDLDVIDSSILDPVGPESVMVFSGPLSGAGAIVVADVGTVRFSGSSASHTGGFVIQSGGTLALDGNYGGSAGTIRIRSGATLTGSGTWGGNIIVEPGGVLDASGLMINGAVSDAPVTFTAYSEAAGTGTPATGWSFYWNAPSNWAVGTEGDLSTGEVTDRSSWRPLIWSGTQWTADGDDTDNNSPSDFLRASTTGGHPGAVGVSRDLDRYVISAFEVGQAGDYKLLLGRVSTQTGGNGVLVKIFLNGALHDELVVPNNDAGDFSYIFNGLALADEIAVAVGANGSTGSDSYQLDYSITLLKAEFANPQIFNVSSFGAVGDGVTDDGPAVSAAIAAWKNAVGPAALHFGTNLTYYLGERTEHKSYFLLSGINDKVVEGNGATLIFTPSNRGFTILDCDNIVVRNFTVDYSPLPFSQGVITSIDAGAGTFVFDPSPGYPDPILQGNKTWGTAYDPATQDIRYAASNVIHMDGLTDLGNGTFEFQARVDSISKISGLELNDLFVFRAYPATSIPGASQWALVRGNGAVSFDSVTIRSAPSFAFGSASNTKPCLFRNITISPPPGSGRLVSSFGDGFHCNESRFGPIIEDGYFTYLMDDTINMKATGFRVNELLGGTILKLGDDDHLVGDVIQFVKDRRDVIGLATVVAINGDETELDAIPVGVNTSDTWVFNLSRANAGYLVQNNYFGTKRRTSGIIRCGNGKVLNNVSERNDGWWVGNELFFTTHEGPMANNILFQGNTMRDTRYGVWIKSSQPSQNLPRPIQDIRMVDNLFENIPEIVFSDVGKLLLERNEFISTPIVVERAENVVFKHCMMDGGEVSAQNVTKLEMDGVDWVNMSGDVLSLSGNSLGYVYNDSMRNGSLVGLEDVTLSGGSQVFFEGARFFNSLSPTTPVLSFVNLVAQFNEPIEAGSGDIILRNLTNVLDQRISITDSSQVTIEGSTLTIDPDPELLSGKDYAVLMEAGVVVIGGDLFPGISNETTWTFSTVDPDRIDVVLNGSFSANGSSFTVWPGYLGSGTNPAAISEWEFFKDDAGNGGIGIASQNSNDNPFAPTNFSNVDYYAFLQHGGTRFVQDLSGRLEPNRIYQISFLAANRRGNTSARGQVLVGDDSETYYDSGARAWSTSAFEFVSAEFITGPTFDGPVQIILSNVTPITVADQSVDFTNIEIVKIDPYDRWTIEYPGFDLSDPNGDIDFDGIPNYVEFALGGDPTQNDAASLLPVFSADANNFSFVHRRADVAFGSDHVPYVAYSLNLVDWYPVTHGANGMTISVSDDGAATGVDSVTVEVNFDQAPQDRLFLRLVVPNP